MFQKLRSERIWKPLRTTPSIRLATFKYFSWYSVPGYTGIYGKAHRIYTQNLYIRYVQLIRKRSLGLFYNSYGYGYGNRVQLLIILLCMNGLCSYRLFFSYSYSFILHHTTPNHTTHQRVQYPLFVNNVSLHCLLL